MSRILILVENLSVPFDRRVWQESRALVEAGHDVIVICPMGTGRDTETEVVLDGVRILRYPLRAASGGAQGYVREYLVAVFHTLRLALRVGAGGSGRCRPGVQPARPAVPGSFAAHGAGCAVCVRSS